MGDTNYFSGTVKILKNPIQRLVKKQTLITLLQVEIFQTHKNKCVLLIFWGNLANKIKASYKKNDYLLIEGYTSIKKTNSKLNKTIITVLRVSPFFLVSRQKLN